MGDQLKEIYKNIPFEISQEKKEEIAKLEFSSLARVRNNPTYKTFNRLFVMGRAPSIKQSNGKPISMWWCICSCPEHNIIKVRINNLTSNNTKSCGCLDKEKSLLNLKKATESCKAKLKGETIGNFLVLEELDERKYNSVVWRCKCLLCGNENYYITTNTLLNHTPKSCGCETRSKGAMIIEELLNKYNMPFIKEKTFDNCRFPDTNKPARFDYFVNNCFLIEYDGEQHYEERDLNYFRDTLEDRQKKDKFKTQWCKNNNIILIRIPYYEIDKIKNMTILDLERYRVC